MSFACQRCGYEAEAAQRMRQGDFAVCALCGTAHTVIRDGLRVTTEGDLQSATPEIRRLIATAMKKAPR